LRFN